MTPPRRELARVEARLLSEPQRRAGLDTHGQPVRLGERDGDGYLVGYIDEQGLAWESLTEKLAATHGPRLAEALSLPYDDPRRDQLLDQLLAELPDELIVDVAREAACLLWLKNTRPPE
jgi:hypothetical protein